MKKYLLSTLLLINIFIPANKAMESKEDKDLTKKFTKLNLQNKNQIASLQAMCIKAGAIDSLLEEILLTLKETNIQNTNAYEVLFALWNNTKNNYKDLIYAKILKMSPKAQKAFTPTKSKTIPEKLLTFSACHNYLLTRPIDDNMLVHLWNIQTGECIQTFQHDPEIPVCTGAISPNAQYVATVMKQDQNDLTSVIIWDVKTGKKIHQKEWTRDICAIIANDKYVVTVEKVGKDSDYCSKNLDLWNIKENTHINPFSTFKCIRILGISDDEALLIIRPMLSNKIIIWNLQENKILYSFSTKHAPGCSNISHNGKHLMLGYYDPSFFNLKTKILNIDTNTQIILPDVLPAAISCDNKYVTLTNKDLSKSFLWNIQTNKALFSIIKDRHSYDIISKTGKYLISRTTTKTEDTNSDQKFISVNIWDIANMIRINSISCDQGDSFTSKIAITPDEQFIVIATGTNTKDNAHIKTEIWRLYDGRELSFDQLIAKIKSVTL